jgi:quercetin dioxygenase-like cupin family protein
MMTMKIAGGLLMPSRIFNELTAAHFVDPQQAETISVLGPTIQFLVPPDDDSAPCIMRGTIPSGGSVPMHSHPESFVMLSGSVEGLVYEDDDFTWLRINPGDVFHVPGEAKHGWRNRGAHPAVMLLVSTARLGKFFREIGKRTPPGAPAVAPSPEEIAHFLRVSERYGYWNATPEENARVGNSVPGT